ncbi:MAG: AAA family ATPase [Cytophagales bacterium]|nr:AAA family ATPase [Cytophagales bacterium]
MYAFNATGKTRLSTAFHQLTKSVNAGEPAGVYYNAYSEDLFFWENNEDQFRLVIRESSLNQYFSQLTEDKIKDELTGYNLGFNFSFNVNRNPEIGIDSITFFIITTYGEAGYHEIKLSRGEERIFIWCFFLALFKVEGFSNMNSHFFIDDPVSSLDDNNIYITADIIFKLIEENFNSDKRIILTTHHIGLFSILFDRLKRGEKSGRYREISTFQMLKRDEATLSLSNFGTEVFLFHLHLIKTLAEAKESQLYTFHFVLLRQLLENISSFIGTSQIKLILEDINVEDPENAIVILNSMSHKKVFIPQINQMSGNEEAIFKEIFDKLIDKYQFRF